MTSTFPARAHGALASLLLAAAALPLAAQEHAHGDGVGTVHFQTSCAPAAAARFDRAVALLHSFELAGAVRGFEETLAADSTCAMAHWGIAISRWANPFLAGTR